MTGKEPSRTARRRGEPKPPDADSGPAGGERIAKALARAGVASRRGAEAMIAAGRVSVDGVVLRTPAVKVTPGQDVRVDGEPLAPPEPARLYRFHKAAGVIVAHHDPQGRPTIVDRLPPPLQRLSSVGLLDFNSEGLLLLTNDRELKRTLELASAGWIRRYRVRAHGRVTQAELNKLAKGVKTDGARIPPVQATLEARKESADAANIWITVALKAGKSRDVRTALETLGLKVNRLIRVAYGPFQLGALKRGEIAEVPAKILRDQLGSRLPARPRRP